MVRAGIGEALAAHDAVAEILPDVALRGPLFALVGKRLKRLPDLSMEDVEDVLRADAAAGRDSVRYLAALE